MQQICFLGGGGGGGEKSPPSTLPAQRREGALAGRFPGPRSTNRWAGWETGTARKRAPGTAGASLGGGGGCAAVSSCLAPRGPRSAVPRHPPAELGRHPTARRVSSKIDHLRSFPNPWDASSLPTELYPRGEALAATDTEGPRSCRSDPRESRGFLLPPSRQAF